MGEAPIRRGRTETWVRRQLCLLERVTEPSWILFASDRKPQTVELRDVKDFYHSEVLHVTKYLIDLN